MLDKTLINYLTEEAQKNKNFYSYKFGLCYFDNERFFNFYTGENPTKKDFNSDKQKYYCLVVEYPAEYYSDNSYVTISTLEKLYKQSDGTVEDFCKNILEFIEV